MALKHPLLSVEEYLELEAKSPVKHDYVAGEIFASAGTTDGHNQLALNLVVTLWTSAKAKGCRVFVSDVKVRTPSDVFYYPDVMMCAEDTDPLVKTKPCILAEVLSKSTESVDRREKLLAYQSIETLQSYLIVGSAEERLEHYVRRGDGYGWVREVITDEGTLHLPCLDLSLSLADVYDGL